MVLCAQVSPEAAKTNLASWAAFIGFQQVPSWLTETKADTWATYIGIAILSISLCLWLWSRTRQRLTIEPARTFERITLLEFFKEAEKQGLNFKATSHTILDLCKELRQVASEGILELWGRARSDSDPLLLIPKEHWYEFRIDWVGAFELAAPNGRIKGFAKDNFFVTSRDSNHPDRKAYFDIHVNRSQALKWLNNNAKRFISKR